MSDRKPPFVAGNWKMHNGLAETRRLIGGILAGAPSLAEASVVVLPPFTALAEAAAALRGTAVGLGAQDLHWEGQGAFTGEVSGPMLADVGCRFVLVGHSERRRLFGETDASVRLKIRAALQAGLRPIVCVGETLEERDAGRTMDRISRQIDEGLADLAPADFPGLVLAYEPVWAIGTGRTASPEQAEEVHAFLRKKIAGTAGNTAADCAIILYGGSVKAANAYSLFREKNIDGFLVGGASLDAASFCGIAREALRAYKEVP
jgi:triosephosphate isomerase